jgi:predicted small secreted protein
MKNYKGEEIKRSWGIAVFGLLLVLAAILLSGCSNQTVRDLEGVPVTDPDKVRLVVNTDTYPNITALCIEGAGFATTTREAAGAMIRVEEWDASNGGWCAE